MILEQCTLLFVSKWIFFRRGETPSPARRSTDVPSRNELNLCKPTKLSFGRVAPLRAVVRRGVVAFDRHFGRDLPSTTTTTTNRTNDLSRISTGLMSRLTFRRIRS